MSKDLFTRTRYLLQNIIKQGLEEQHITDAEALIEEFGLLMQSDEVQDIENTIAEAERKVVSEDLADEIMNSKQCVGGNCED